MEYQNSVVNNQNNINIQNLQSKNQNDSISQLKNYIFILEQNLKNQSLENNKLKNEILQFDKERINLNEEIKKKII
jgi:hypothetical protein